MHVTVLGPMIRAVHIQYCLVLLNIVLVKPCFRYSYILVWSALVKQVYSYEDRS